MEIPDNECILDDIDIVRFVSSDVGVAVLLTLLIYVVFDRKGETLFYSTTLIL